MMFLSHKEVVELTGYKRAGWQANALSKMGYTFDLRMNGSVVVLRTHVEKKLGFTTKTQAKAYTPNAEGLKRMCDG